MSLRKPKVKMSVEEYLESEKDGTIRHEYVDGEVFAMSSASKRHNRVASNLTIQLSARLRGRAQRFPSAPLRLSPYIA
jgi:Uma2 family endonuclease